MAGLVVAAWALLAGRTAALSREDRRLAPALPVDGGGWNASADAHDYSGALLDAPVPTFHATTALFRVNASLATARRRRRLGGFPAAAAVGAGGGVNSADAAEGGTTPLFMGIGTHYAHVYVGTPAQRVSVIVDTGSHHTAFPCSGCKSCGKHTDPYFDPAKSTTLTRLGCDACVAAARCVSKACQVSQSYTEGSSWKAVQMRDQYYVGGTTGADDGGAKGWIQTPFVFGCQTYETGLFRTQKADGIMGMSMHAQTLVPTMRADAKLNHNSFSLCFMHGGGTMALGGVDDRSHRAPMQFVPLAKNSGWFTVKLLDVLVGGKSIGVPASTYATGKGTIVDSGTTDTYLPRRAADKFKAAWAAAVGASPKYANTKLTFSPAQVAKLPTLTFAFENGVKIDVKPDAYLERAAGKYVPRVYLTESSGAVLGANFMQNHDIFFDAEHRRVGFAEADCSYGRAQAGAKAAPTAPPKHTLEPNDTMLIGHDQH